MPTISSAASTGITGFWRITHSAAFSIIRTLASSTTPAFFRIRGRLVQPNTQQGTTENRMEVLLRVLTSHAQGGTVIGGSRWRTSLPRFRLKMVLSQERTGATGV